MSEQIFTAYKAAVDAEMSRVGFLVPAHDETVLLNMKRLAHRNNVPAERCADCVMTLLGAPVAGRSETEFGEEAVAALTEAGAVALEQRDALRAIDSALGVPASTAVASPEPLPALDPCSDDELTPVNHGSLPGFAKPVEKTRKVPRK